LKLFRRKTPKNTVLHVKFMRKIYNVLVMITRLLWFKMDMEEIARWAYIGFVVIAIVAGLAIGYMAYSEPPTGSEPWYQNVAESNGYVILIMLILGIIIGLTSITTKEVTPFLVATIALVVSYAADVWLGFKSVEMLSLLYYWATAILTYIVAFAAPAAVIIAIKSVFAIAKEK